MGDAVPRIRIARHDLMIITRVDPHGFRLAGSRKPAFPVEANRPSIRNQHVLVEAFVDCHQSSHQFIKKVVSLPKSLYYIMVSQITK